MLKSYEGSEPYIFVSYSHRDSRFVHRVISHLQGKGYRVWFDGGIEVGSEWIEYIASHLDKCECVLTFISKEFVASDNCKRELNFALELKKKLLCVYVEDVNLSAGMRMQLGLTQAMYRKHFREDQEKFLEALAQAKILEGCLEKTAVVPSVSEDISYTTDGKNHWRMPGDFDDFSKTVVYKGKMSGKKSKNDLWKQTGKDI